MTEPKTARIKFTKTIGDTLRKAGEVVIIKRQIINLDRVMFLCELSDGSITWLFKDEIVIEPES